MDSKVGFTAPAWGFKETLRPKVFMAGGCGGCPWWQTEMLSKLEEASQGKYDILNPRRQVWPDSRPEVEEQIRWEYEGLNESEIILYWFPEETLCPITLYELGRFAADLRRKIIVGAHSGYQRRQDLEIQLSLLVRPLKVLGTPEEVYEETVRSMNTIR